MKLLTSITDPFLPVESTAPTLEALNLMVKWGVHRIPIVDAEGELITVLSQSQMVAFMYPFVIILLECN